MAPAHTLPSPDLEQWRGDPNLLASQQAIRKEHMELLDGALEQLTDDQRAAVLLKHFHDWTVAEIAGQLGRTEDAVAGLLRRGLKKLRAAMNAAR